jgi:AcrR family transcriptional regulator
VPKIVDHEARRRDFIAAAYATIMEEGLARTTVRAVARKAGYTTGALVHYFKDKDELIREALDYFGNEVRGRMRSAQGAQTGRAALRETLVESLPTDARAASSWRVWLALWYHSESSADMRDEERRRYREWIGRLARMIEESKLLGELPTSVDAREEARMLVALVDGLGVQYLMAGRRMGAVQMTAAIDRYLDRLYPSKPPSAKAHNPR